MFLDVFYDKWLLYIIEFSLIEMSIIMSMGCNDFKSYLWFALDSKFHSTLHERSVSIQDINVFKTFSLFCHKILGKKYILKHLLHSKRL